MLKLVIYQFCPVCAHKLESGIIDGRERQFCSRCNFIHYRNPLPTTVCIGELEGKILLIKRGVKPLIGQWTLPSGFIELGETPEASCLRELKEETGMTGTIIRLIGLYHANSQIYRDIISAIYHIKLNPGEPIAGDDAIDVKFVPIEEVDDLLFPAFNHA
ncbi:MAG TPA: NUDIX hydrolase, partial [Syntrophomonadaceae bacterium]|nr:NUDIX hydrolase [Syntrophomonadaceae bacterium]